MTGDESMSMGPGRAQGVASQSGVSWGAEMSDANVGVDVHGGQGLGMRDLGRGVYLVLRPRPIGRRGSGATWRHAHGLLHGLLLLPHMCPRREGIGRRKQEGNSSRKRPN